MTSKKRLKTYSIVLESTPKAIRRLETFLQHALHGIRIDDTRYHDLLVSTTEAVNNAIIHGNRRDPRKNVYITCEIQSDRLTLKIRDEGAGFNPDSIPDPLHPENLTKASGRGLLVIRTLMDNLEFNISPRGTEAVLTMLLTNR